MPSWLRELASRLKGSFHSSGAEVELSDELQAHLEMLTEENIRRGMDANEARRQARLKLGNHLQINEDYRQSSRSAIYRSAAAGPAIWFAHVA